MSLSGARQPKITDVFNISPQKLKLLKLKIGKSVLPEK
jgi:hypothetical protein